MSTAILGKSAYVALNSTEVGFCTGVSLEVTTDLLQAYKNGSTKPCGHEAGNQHFKATIDSMFLANTYISGALAGTKYTLDFEPEGNSSGMKFTISNFIITSAKVSGVQDGWFLQNITGEGDDLTIGTV
jgi:hypothetical protein